MFCASGLVFGDTRVSVPVFMFYALGLVFDGRGALGLVFLFCATGLIFDGTEGVGSRFLVLHAQTRFRRFRGRQVPFSCFARPDSFSAVPSASGPVFLFCVPGLIFGGTEGIRSRFDVMRSGTSFRRYRGRRVPFLRFALPNSFSTVPRASGPVFRFCAPELVFGGTGGVRSCFLAFSARTRFRRFRGRRVPFSWFALPDSFSAVPGASGPVFMFCAPELVFGGTKCVGSRFLVLCSQTRFRWYRRRWFPFSRFALPDSFSTVPRASCPVFMFCAPGLIFCGTGLVPFSCFPASGMFSAVPWASGPVFMFCALGLVFGGTGGVGSRFPVLRSRTHFLRSRDCQVPFCAPGLVFTGSRGVGSRFLVLRVRTRFRRFRGRLVQFSCFARPNSFSAVP
jgi:hypothetical protein